MFIKWNIQNASRLHQFMLCEMMKCFCQLALATDENAKV